MVTYREGHPPIKLPGTLITWSCEITQKLETSPLPELVLSPNFTWC